MAESFVRDPDAGRWPPRWPFRTVSLLLLALAAGGAVGYDRYTRWTPLQHLYLRAYLRSHVYASVGLSAGTYQFIHVVNRQGGDRLALDEEVQPVDGGWALTDTGRTFGDQRLVWSTQRLGHAAVHAHLRQWVYNGQGVLALATIPMEGAVAIFAVGLWFTVPMDRAALRGRRQGIPRRGASLLENDAAFNAAVKSHRWTGDQGIRIQTGAGTITSLSRRGGVRLPPGAQYRHMVAFGAPGSGKSSWFRQLLVQARARGERAVIWDAAMEWTREFYDPEQGDVIVTPNDIRSPYWAVEEEITTEFDADALAEAFLPHQPRSNEFFTNGPRQILAYLLRFKPTAATLRLWLSDDAQLDRLLDEHQEGRSIAHIVSRRAPAQREGVLASLNMIAKALALVPDEGDTTHRWSTAAWATQRTGFLFVSSTPMTRARLSPLLSAWIDMLVLRTMTRPDERDRRSRSTPTWFFLDEFASLHRLQHAQTALAEGRKSECPIVMGLQSRSQLEPWYGQQSDGMVACTGTQIYFRSPEPNTADFVSKAIGQREVDRVKQSRSEGRGFSRYRHSDQLENHLEPLFLPSQISGLENMHGILKYNNHVVKIQIPFVKRPTIAPDFLPRPENPLLVAPPSPVAGTATTSATNTTGASGVTVDWVWAK